MHKHCSHHKAEVKSQKLLLSVWINIAIVIVQVAGGIVSGSLSVLSDAMHNFGDVVALLISFLAIQLTKKSYTATQTFGYKRAEIIAALFNTILLYIVSFLLIKEAVLRLLHPEAILSVWVIVLAGIGIAGNGLCVLLLKNETSKNSNMKSAYLHLFTDMITSIVVLLGGVLMYLYQVYWVDSALTLLIAAYLMYSGFNLFKDTLYVLMQFAPKNVDVQKISEALLTLPQVKNIHHVHIWQLNDNEIHFLGHVDFKNDLPLSEVNTTLKSIETILEETFHIHHCMLQPEIYVLDSKELVVDESHSHNHSRHHFH